MQNALVSEQRQLAAPADLIAQSLSGNEEAFATIMALHDRDMARLCHVICRDPHTSEDALQNAWHAAWRRLASLRDPSKLKPWLLRIASNEARSLAGKERRSISMGGLFRAEERSVPSSSADHIDLTIALDRLTPEERELVGMRYVLGLDSVEIGQTTGLNPSTVRSRLAVITARLRTQLSEE